MAFELASNRSRIAKTNRSYSRGIKACMFCAGRHLRDAYRRRSTPRSLRQHVRPQQFQARSTYTPAGPDRRRLVYGTFWYRRRQRQRRRRKSMLFARQAAAFDWSPPPSSCGVRIESFRRSAPVKLAFPSSLQPSASRCYRSSSH